VFIIDSVLRHLSKNKVTVFAFHKTPLVPDPIAPLETDLAAFTRILDFVAERFSVISMRDAIEGLARKSGAFSDRGAVCLTFDDGYIDWFTGVVPVLRQRRMPATFFITTGQLNGMPLWHERVRRAVQGAGNSVVDVSSPSRQLISVASSIERIKAVAAIEAYLKYQTLDVRERLIVELEAQTGSDPAAIPRMNAQQVRDLHNAGFDIGTHTVEHPILTRCDAARARVEISSAKETLEEIIGGEVPYFAYPNGRSSDYTSEHIALVKESGYRCALTTQEGAWTEHASQFQIPRFTPWGPNSVRLAFQLSRNLRHKDTGLT
jgi:peptidoglycan/xylan/chitin deacetylase (PgdA/CDA1 family)